MNWTTAAPNPPNTGDFHWYWYRHMVGGNAHDECVKVIRFRSTIKRKSKWMYKYDRHQSAYWRGEWRKVKDIPVKPHRTMWSDTAIPLPTGFSPQ